MTQSPGNSSAQILTFGPIPMTHPAKTPPDALLPQIYCIISPLTETGEEAECLNFSPYNSGKDYETGDPD